MSATIAVILEQTPALCAMAALLLLSAFFSGSETALFSITGQQLNVLRQKDTRARRALLELIEHPDDVLIVILFGNMVVNILYYSVSAALAWRVGAAGGKIWAGGVAAGALLIVILCGEIGPKSVAVNLPARVGLLAAIPLYVLYALLTPVRVVVRRISHRADAVVGRFAADPTPAVTSEELHLLVSTSEEHGVISPEEGGMLADAVALSRLLVRHALVPRADVAMCDVGASVDVFKRTAWETKHSKIPVYDGQPDEVVGFIYTRHVLLSEGGDLRQFVQPIDFVLQSNSLESTLASFRERGTQIAAVVSEHGGFQGIVTLEDIVEEIVGEIHDEYDQAVPLVQTIGPDRYVLNGRLSIREWDELFDLHLDPTEVVTVAGFITWIAGRLLREGESVTFRNLKFTVEEVLRHRIIKVSVEMTGDEHHV